jgi:hypothetical protein
MMNISYETTQQFLTYVIEFFGFIAFFVLPCEYIAKRHIEEVRSWGVPGNPQIAQIEVKVKEVEVPKRASDKSAKSTTKTNRTRKKMKEIPGVPGNPQIAQIEVKVKEVKAPKRASDKSAKSTTKTNRTRKKMKEIPT